MKIKKKPISKEAGKYKDKTESADNIRKCDEEKQIQKKINL